jgi:TonB family protein
MNIYYDGFIRAQVVFLWLVFLTGANSCLAEEPHNPEPRSPQVNGAVCAIRVPPPSPELSEYPPKVISRIKESWKQSHQELKNPIIIRLKVMKNGTVKDLQIFRSSGNKSVDQAAIRCVTKSTPFDKFSPAIAQHFPALENLNMQLIFASGLDVDGGYSSGEVITPELQAWSPELVKRVNQRWDNSHQQIKNYIILHFKVMKNGTIGGIKIFESSGIRSVDQLAISCLKQSAPFAPLPPDNERHWTPEYMQFYLRFKPELIEGRHVDGWFQGTD